MSQTEFTTALLDANAPIPDGVVDPQGRPAGRRFDVYRNNVIVSLSKALASAYPAIERLVGAQFFSAMANVYVRANPPQTPLMIHYGGNFPDWLAGFEPAARLPYLPDVARLERARRRAYHAADARIMPPERLAAITEDDLPDARFQFVAAMEIVTSPYPIMSIWRKTMQDPDHALPAGGEVVLVARPDDDLEMRTISVEIAQFLGHLRSLPLGDALDQMGEDFDFSAALGGMLAARLLSDITTKAG